MEVSNGVARLSPGRFCAYVEHDFPGDGGGGGCEVTRFRARRGTRIADDVPSIGDKTTASRVAGPVALQGGWKGKLRRVRPGS